MALAGGDRPHPRALIFDLDRCVIDPRPAWCYCIEESIAAAEGLRKSARELIDEYHQRPWHHALGVLLDSPEVVTRCAELSQAMFERSGMKKLLVHEGVTMALDALRVERIELGAVSRMPHGVAVKQIHSTGLDRFLAVLSATPPGEDWNPATRFDHCLRFLEASAAASAFVSGEERDLLKVMALGTTGFAAGWAPSLADPVRAGVAVPVEQPAALLAAVLRTWSLRA